MSTAIKCPPDGVSGNTVWLFIPGAPGMLSGRGLFGGFIQLNGRLLENQDDTLALASLSV